LWLRIRAQEPKKASLEDFLLEAEDEEGCVVPWPGLSFSSGLLQVHVYQFR
jgi:hypothetical protein